jgi:adhesin transport system outer membrane protein
MIKFIPLLLLPLMFLSLNADKDILPSEVSNCSVEFRELVLEGLHAHPSIEMSKESIKGAELEVDIAKWGYYPTPSIDYSVKSKDKNQYLLRAEQPLWTGGKLDASYDKAKAIQKEANFELEENRYKLIDNYLDRVKEYLRAQDKVVVLNKNKREFYKLSEMLDRFMDAGELSLSDKNLLNSRISHISSDLIITKAKHKVAKTQLEILTGKNINCNINFEYQEIFSTHLDVDELVKSLKDTHPTLKIMDAKILIANAEADSAKAGLLPNLVLRAEHKKGTIYDDYEPGEETIVYLSFNITTGAGLSGLSKIDKTKIETSRAKFEKNTKFKELLDILMADYTNLITASAHINMLEEDIKVAQLIFESNERLFLSEKKSWIDVVNSLAELNKQKINYAELLIDKKILQFKIGLKTGKIDLETLEVTSDL